MTDELEWLLGPMPDELDEDKTLKPMTERSKRKLKCQRHRHEPHEQVARAVRAARQYRGWTQADLARAMDTQQPNIARIENGRTKPSMALLQKLSNVLDIELELFYKPEVKVNQFVSYYIDDLNK